MEKNKNILRRIFSILIIAFSLAFISGCSQSTKPVNAVNQQATQVANEAKNNTKGTDSSGVNGNLKVHYINVGQGDSILIQQGNQNMLIDTGTNASTSSLISYLKSQNITKLDYLVLTHPHEDHIGGADAVIKTFDIGTIYMPKVTTNTVTFKDLVNAMNSKGLKATQPTVGDSFKLGDANCIILSPISTVNGDMNTYSIVIKVTFGNNKFLFTGDAQNSNEQDMINKGFDLSADVLKVGHHGSHTSTSQSFLDKVNPKYAVISCGEGNDYGHPHKETMDKLQTKNIAVYRTDQCGTIVVTSDGKNIKFNVNTGDYTYGSSSTNTLNNNYSSSSNNNSSSEKQYVDANGNGLIKGNINSKGEKIYHLPGGAYYNKTNPERWFKTESEAQAAGFRRSQR